MLQAAHAENDRLACHAGLQHSQESDCLHVWQPACVQACGGQRQAELDVADQAEIDVQGSVTGVARLCLCPFSSPLLASALLAAP